MNGLGLTVMRPWPQFTVTLAFTSALTSATAGTVRSNASWTERANEDEGVAARPALAASTVAHRTLDAPALIESAPHILAFLVWRGPQAQLSQAKGAKRKIAPERACKPGPVSRREPGRRSFL